MIKIPPYMESRNHREPYLLRCIDTVTAIVKSLNGSLLEKPSGWPAGGVGPDA